MKVRSIEEANKADVIFPIDYIKDEVRSERVGYDILYSTPNQIADALSFIDTAIYNIDDKVNIDIKDLVSL